MLPALMALGGATWGDPTGRDMPSQPCPALAAASLVYALVTNPLGAKTWAEREIEAIRTGAHDETREDTSSQATFILLALHTRSTEEYALEMMEAPRELEAPAAASDPDRPVEAIADPRLESAFEAMGITPGELLGTPEIPPAALTLAGAIISLLDWGLGRGAELRGKVRGSTTLRIDPEERYERPGHLRYQKPIEQPKDPPLIFSKKIVRSIYKMLLGVAIGILIWGFVRNTA